MAKILDLKPGKRKEKNGLRNDSVNMAGKRPRGRNSWPGWNKLQLDDFWELKVFRGILRNLGDFEFFEKIGREGVESGWKWRFQCHIARGKDDVFLRR